MDSLCSFAQGNAGLPPGVTALITVAAIFVSLGIGVVLKKVSGSGARKLVGILTVLGLVGLIGFFVMINFFPPKTGDFDDVDDYIMAAFGGVGVLCLLAAGGLWQVVKQSVSEEEQ